MIFTETRLKGAFIVDPELHHDERGFFARAWCQKEFQAHDLVPVIAQCNISFNRSRGTLRGMHFQAAPFEEAKLVRCTAGSIHDVIIDLRPHSATYMQPLAEVLTAANHRMMYVPEGFAHGFQALEDNTEVLYLMSQFHSPGHARGVRYNDPAFGIEWPIGDPVIADRDRNYPDFCG